MIRSNPVGEGQIQSFQLPFIRFLRVDFHASRLTSYGGLILVRELGKRFGLSRRSRSSWSIPARDATSSFRSPDLLWQSVRSRLVGYDDLNDAARLSVDPTFLLMGSEKVWERGGILTSTLPWLLQRGQVFASRQVGGRKRIREK
jgi:hypothetical protein